MSETAPLCPTPAGRLAKLQQVMDATRARMIDARPAPIIVAVSKTHPAAAVEELIALGLTHFAENRVQEALAKWPALKAAHPQTLLHLIGPLQSNKAEAAVTLFDVVETLDRPKIADALAAACHKLGRFPDMLVQVNTGEEPQKGGVIPAEADRLIAYAKSRGLNVTGLMCIPPAAEPPAPHFALLRQIAERNSLSVLSMGMSDDYPEAIRMGATHIRPGTALFGARRV